MTQLPPRARFLQVLQQAAMDASLVKLTLGKYRGADPTLKNLFVRPVSLKAGPHLCFLWRHQTQDITKNHPIAEGLAEIDRLIGTQFYDAHLFTPAQTGQLETKTDGSVKVKMKLADAAPPPSTTGHDRTKSRAVNPHAGWLRDLGITNEHGQPRTGHAPKFRQIQNFAEVLQHLLAESGLTTADSTDAPPLQIADMGCGKGYLTFATADLLGARAQVRGIELRSELVESCNGIALKHQLTNLTFQTGDINSAAADLGKLDVLIALHACDTATDDALAAGVAAGAKLLVLSPCCHQELRPQLTAPSVLAPALRHGILHERQAEFVTDALRALLLESQGFTTKIFEFVSTEHTAKNLMLVAFAPVDQPRHPSPTALRNAREFAQFYGIKNQALARHLGITLES
jgi:SAM-dependent methyltransferase